MDAADRNTLALATEDPTFDICPRGPGDELDLEGDIYEQVQGIYGAAKEAGLDHGILMAWYEGAMEFGLEEEHAYRLPKSAPFRYHRALEAGRKGYIPIYLRGL